MTCPFDPSARCVVELDTQPESIAPQTATIIRNRMSTPIKAGCYSGGSYWANQCVHIFVLRTKNPTGEGGV